MHNITQLQAAESIQTPILKATESILTAMEFQKLIVLPRTLYSLHEEEDAGYFRAVNIHGVEMVTQAGGNHTWFIYARFGEGPWYHLFEVPTNEPVWNEVEQIDPWMFQQIRSTSPRHACRSMLFTGRAIESR